MLVGVGYQRDEPVALAAHATHKVSALIALTHPTKLMLASGGLFVAPQSICRRAGERPRRGRGGAGFRVGWSGLASVRAERKREYESAKYERAELAFTHFLRGPGLFGALQAVEHHPSCVTSTQ